MSAPDHSGSTAAIVLAAGRSRRMGRPKLLLPFGDLPMLEQVIRTLTACAGVSPVIMVTGPEPEETLEIVAQYTGVVCVENAEAESGGMVSSIRRGAAAAPESAVGLLVALGDQPLIRAESIEQLLSEWRRSGKRLAVPVYEGRRGHPVLLSAGLRPHLLALREPETLKTLMARHKDEICEVIVSDPGVLKDIDTPEQYNEALRDWREASR